MNTLYDHHPYYGYPPYVNGGDISNYNYDFPPPQPRTYKNKNKNQNRNNDNCDSAPRPLSHSSKQETKSIPVNFIHSTQPKPKPTRSESAVKIQRTFREFVWRRNVKKSMRKIADLHREIDDVANRYLKGGEGLDLLKRDGYERFKVSEMVLGLIIKLDCVEIVDDSVRVCRKGLVKKAVLLQEKIDSLADEIASESQSESEEKMEVSETTTTPAEEEVNEDEWLIVDESSGSKQRLMEMVADLCRKNAQQARIISSLSERVKQMEKVTRRLTGAVRD